MEYGLIPKLEVSATDLAREIQKIQRTNPSLQVQEGKESKDIERDEFLRLHGAEKTAKITSVQNHNYIEYSLTNFNFGFNNKSRDFFVRAVRGEAENQYPTDDMMRLKAFLLKVNSETQVS